MPRFLMNQPCGPKGHFPSFSAHISDSQTIFVLLHLPKCLKKQIYSASTATFYFLIFNSTVFKRLLPHFLVGGLKREVRDATAVRTAVFFLLTCLGGAVLFGAPSEGRVCGGTSPSSGGPST